MAKPRALPASLDAFVRDMVSSGRYGSAAEVIVEGLRLLQSREAAGTACLQRDWLKKAWREGIESGEPVDATEVFDRLIAKYESVRKAHQA